MNENEDHYHDHHQQSNSHVTFVVQTKRSFLFTEIPLQRRLCTCEPV